MKQYFPKSFKVNISNDYPGGVIIVHYNAGGILFWIHKSGLICKRLDTIVDGVDLCE